MDYVDEEMLALMGKAGCWLISWGIESGNEQILKHARKGADPAKAERALRWAKKAGIKNWGYFIIGLPGETEDDHPPDDRLRQETAARHRPVPRRRALSRDTLLLRGGQERLVPPGHALGAGRHGQGDGPGLPGPLGRAAAVLAEAGVPRVGLPAGPDLHLSQDAALRPLDVQDRPERWAAALELAERATRGMRGFVAGRGFALALLGCAAAPTVVWAIAPDAGWMPLAIAILPWIALARWGSRPAFRTRLDPAIALFLIAATIGLWTAYDPAAALAKFRLVLSAVLLYYALAYQPAENLWPIAGALAGLGTAVSLPTLWAGVGSAVGSSSVLPAASSDAYAGVMALTIPYTLAVLLEAIPAPKPRWGAPGLLSPHPGPCRVVGVRRTKCMGRRRRCGPGDVRVGRAVHRCAARRPGRLAPGPVASSSSSGAAVVVAAVAVLVAGGRWPAGLDSASDRREADARPEHPAIGE